MTILWTNIEGGYVYVIMDSSKLKVGDKIRIMKVEHPTNQYSSQILDILSENKYIIAGPIRRSTIIYIKPNTVVEVGYYKEKIGKFVFKAVVKEVWEKGIYKLKVERVSDIVKIQERNFFRLPVALKVEKDHNVEQVYSEKNYIHSENEKEICIAGDISGGGVKLFTNIEHKHHDKIRLKLVIRGIEIITIGEVVRISETKTNDYKHKFKYEIGVKFVDIDDYQRDVIVKYIFEQERELRKKRIDFNGN